MRETHELLDSIERKVQNCIGEGDSYEKLLFSQRRNNKDTSKTISTVRDRTATSLMQTYKKNNFT